MQTPECSESSIIYSNCDTSNIWCPEGHSIRNLTAFALAIAGGCIQLLLLIGSFIRRRLAIIASGGPLFMVFLTILIHHTAHVNLSPTMERIKARAISSDQGTFSESYGASFYLMLLALFINAGGLALALMNWREERDTGIAEQPQPKPTVMTVPDGQKAPKFTHGVGQVGFVQMGDGRSLKHVDEHLEGSDAHRSPRKSFDDLHNEPVTQ